jgi:pectinesterase
VLRQSLLFQCSKRLALLLLVTTIWGHAQGETPQLFPANDATNVNPDTHLVLSFSGPPTIGTSGLIRIYDAVDHSLIDTLDMSIPPSPRPTGRAPRSTEAERQALAASTRMTDYQVNTVGGIDFHFFPIIVRGNKATIYPHNNKLKYGRKYRVQIDPTVLRTAQGEVVRFAANGEWAFTTKKAAPSPSAERVVVAADGSGDFNTLQGAVDFAPAQPSDRLTIFVKKGLYEELVFIEGKSSVTVRGEDREAVQVGYPNNSAFNPSRGGPSRRPAFSIYKSTGIQLSTFTINNYFLGQAEALLVNGQQIVIDRMTLNGSGDALTTYGAIYMVDSKLTGDGDTILGYASLFCRRCEVHSRGPFTWTRTPQGIHGHVFVDSTFIAIDEPLPWTVNADGTGGQMASKVLARLPRNGAGSSQANFPYAEMVLINSRMKGVPPEGWGPIEAAPGFDSSNVRFWEFNTLDIEGRPIDVSRRHPLSKQLKRSQDAKSIVDYGTPEFVLNGWTPVVH